MMKIHTTRRHFFFITTIPFILTALRKGNNIRCNRLVETTAFVLFVTVFSNVL